MDILCHRLVSLGHPSNLCAIIETLVSHQKHCPLLYRWISSESARCESTQPSILSSSAIQIYSNILAQCPLFNLFSFPLPFPWLRDTCIGLKSSRNLETWHEAVLPHILDWASSLEEPFSISTHPDLEDLIKYAWDEEFPEILVDDAIHYVVCCCPLIQSLMNSFL